MNDDVVFIINDLFFTTYFDGSPHRLNREDILIISDLITIWLTGIVLLPMQLGLWKRIRRNYQVSIDQFLEPQ